MALRILQQIRNLARLRVYRSRGPGASVNFDGASYFTAYSQFGPLVGLSVQGGTVFMNFERASYFTTYSQFGALAGLCYHEF